MENVFEHDAIPTWSGFIYQGRIAAYLAIKKIIELRDDNKVSEVDKYAIEMEKCEDIAIVYQCEKEKREYISIHQVKNEKENETLKYILERNNIKFISEEEKVNVPNNYQITYISPKGKLILGSNEGNNSTHDEIASKIRPRIDKDSRKSMAELLAKGFIIFADISCEDENMACICYVENNTTKAQHDRLQEIKNNCNYEYIPDANSLEDVLEQLKEKAIDDNDEIEFVALA